jgi:hypothetical protein
MPNEETMPEEETMPNEESLPRVECYFTRFTVQELCALTTIASRAVAPQSPDLAIWLVKAADAELERRQEAEKGNYIEPEYPVFHPEEWDDPSSVTRALLVVCAWARCEVGAFRPLVCALSRVFCVLATINLRKQESRA